MNLSRLKIGLSSFLIVLLFMPLGHALMVLTEKILAENKFLGAFSIGSIGVVLLIFSVSKTSKDYTSTILGMIAAILVWTGWIEFSFVWIAEKQNISAFMEHGEVVTRQEYLIMPSSVGLLGAFFLLFLFTQTKCEFFNWIQKATGIKTYGNSKKPLAIITFIETVMLLWFFYIVLLLVYDNDIAGDRHPLTYIVAFGSLFWSLYLFLNLLKISKFDYAIRYAIPTVIIFWNFIEILGRWNLFKEIWIYPLEHRLEIAVAGSILAVFVGYYFLENRKGKTSRHLGKHEEKAVSD